MKIYRFRTTISTAGGAGSANTNPIIGGLCRSIFIQALTSGTTFQANIQSAYANTMRAFTNTVTQLNYDERVLPMEGVYTLQITSASADGQFQCEFMVQE